MNKLISVIMPVRNGEKYLQAALDGIKKQNMNVEIILVNDASTDSTAEIALKAGCHVINHDVCKGPAVGKNTGLQVAKGEYILFHDGDDVMRSGVLAKMYRELEQDATVSAVMAMVQNFTSAELISAETKRCDVKAAPFYGLFSGAILIRKRVFDIVGPFSEEITAGDVIAWKLQLDKHNLLIKKLDFVATDRRIHDSNYGKTNRKKEFLDYASILRAKLRKQ